MTLEILEKEMANARRNKDTVRITVLSGLVSAVKKAAIDKRCKDNITEELVDEILIKEQKMVQEMIDTCPADRTELLRDYHNRMVVIREFAPQLLTDKGEIAHMITSIVPTGTAFVKKDRGIIMKTIAPHFKGKADMKIVNQVLNEMLV